MDPAAWDFARIRRSRPVRSTVRSLIVLAVASACAFGAPAEAADVSISASLPSRTVDASASYELKFDIQNETASGTGVGLEVSAYYSTDRLLDASDASLGSQAISPLGSDELVSGTIDITVPAGSSGSAYVIVRADDGDVLIEPNESDNLIILPIAVGDGVAIFLDKVSVQAGATPGGSISIGYDVDNQEAQDVLIRLVARLIDNTGREIENEAENKEVTVAPGVRSVQRTISVPADAALGPAAIQLTVLSASKTTGEDVIVGDSGLLVGAVSIQSILETSQFQAGGLYVGRYADRLLSDNVEFKRFFDLAQSNVLDVGVKTVLLQVNVDTLTQKPELYDAFITRALSLGMSVQAVLPEAKLVEQENEAIEPIQAILAYGSSFPASRFSGIHFSSQPENAPSVGNFVQAYEKLLDGVKTSYSNQGETLATQGLAVSIAVDPAWLEAGEVSDLLSVSDLDFFVVRPNVDDAAEVISGTQQLLAANLASKPFALLQDTQESLVSVSGGTPSGNTWFEEGPQDLLIALNELELKYGEAELYRGVAFASYESAFTPWHMLESVDAPEGTYQAGGVYAVNIGLRTSDPYAVRSYRVELQVRDAAGNLFPDPALGDDQVTRKSVTMKGIDRVTLKLEWEVPEAASLEPGPADVVVVVWDVDLNGSDDEGRPPVGTRDVPVELIRTDLSDAITIETAGGGFLASDFDRDGRVTFEDFLLFVGAFGTSQGQSGYEARFDLTGDNRVDFSDFLAFAQEFGR